MLNSKVSRSFSVTVFLLFVVLTTVQAGTEQLSLEGYWEFQGQVGEYPVTATLDVDGLYVWGSYSYDGIGIQIRLTGVAERSGDLLMFELDEEEYQTGSFRAVLSADGIHGKWIHPDTGQELPVLWNVTTRDIWSGIWSRAFVGADGQWKWSIHESASVEFWDWEETSASMEIWASSGSHMGFADGQVIIQDHRAEFHDPDLGGTFVFERRGSELVVTTQDAYVYAGAGVAFDGVYRQRFGADSYPTLWDLGVFPTKELDQAFRQLVGETYYEKYLTTFHLFHFSEDKDGLNAVVVDGFVRGLAGEMFGRIMYTKEGYFAAAISEGDGWLTYISNHPRFEFEVPRTFDDLRDRLAFG